MTTKTDAEYYTFKSGTATGYFFLMYFMYVLASLPFVYVFSFIPKSSIMAFTNFFILNVIVCVIDAVIASIPVFSQNNNPSAGPTKIYNTISNVRWIFAIVLPTVNLKHAISNIVFHDNSQCILVNNAMLGTKFATNEAWFSKNRPGVGTEFILFCAQMVFWWIMLMIVESRMRIKQCCCSCGGGVDTDESDQWNDSVRDKRWNVMKIVFSVCSIWMKMFVKNDDWC